MKVLWAWMLYHGLAAEYSASRLAGGSCFSSGGGGSGEGFFLPDCGGPGCK